MSRFQHRAGKAAVFGVAIVIAASLGGCGLPGAFLNPEFAASLGLTQSASNLPGEAPSVLVTVENATGRQEIEALVSWRDVDGEVQTRTFSPNNGTSLSELLICPIPEITLGDVGNLQSVGAIVILGNGGPNDPIVEVEPFGVLLQEGVNYNCGDGVTFRVETSSRTLSGYQVFAYIRRSNGSP